MNLRLVGWVQESEEIDYEPRSISNYQVETQKTN